MEHVRKEIVNFPEGPRQVTPISWTRQPEGFDEPSFDIPGYRVVKTVDGCYVAVRDPTCQQV